MEQINDKVTNVFVAKNEEELKKAFTAAFIRLINACEGNHSTSAVINYTDIT